MQATLLEAENERIREKIRHWYYLQGKLAGGLRRLLPGLSVNSNMWTLAALAVLAISASATSDFGELNQYSNYMSGIGVNVTKAQSVMVRGPLYCQSTKTSPHPLWQKGHSSTSSMP